MDPSQFDPKAIETRLGLNTPFVDRERVHAHAESASGFYENLQTCIEEVEDGLEQDEQLDVLYCGPTGIVVRVETIESWGLNLIRLEGKDTEGGRMVVLTHQHSLQLVLRVVKIGPQQERHPIGFQVC